jgi:hypothetical protein
MPAGNYGNMPGYPQAAQFNSMPATSMQNYMAGGYQYQGQQPMYGTSQPNQYMSQNQYWGGQGDSKGQPYVPHDKK